MPMAMMLSWVRSAESSSTLGMSTATRSASTRRAMERLMRVIFGPSRTRSATISSSPPGAVRSTAARSAATASKSRSSTFSKISGSGRWVSRAPAASESTRSTRFCRDSASASPAGVRMSRDSSRAEKTWAPMGSVSCSGWVCGVRSAVLSSRAETPAVGSGPRKVTKCSPRVMTSPERRRSDSRMGTRFTRVPFLLPRSTTQ
jgi:hypothetical protein